MQNQFFYTRREIIKGEDNAPDTFRNLRDSFNVEKVIRTMSMDDGRLLVLLDDIHERVADVPIIDHKKNTIRGSKRERGTYQSEIYISDEAEIENYYKSTAI